MRGDGLLYPGAKARLNTINDSQKKDWEEYWHHERCHRLDRSSSMGGGLGSHEVCIMGEGDIPRIRFQRGQMGGSDGQE